MIGNFGKLEPSDKGRTPLCKRKCVLWQSINSVMCLENSHTFKDNLEWGIVLSRLRIGKTTEKDIHIINERH